MVIVKMVLIYSVSSNFTDLDYFLTDPKQVALFLKTVNPFQLYRYIKPQTTD